MAFRRMRYAVPGLFLVLLGLFIVTPVGPWLMGGLGVRLASSYGWQLEIGRTGGRLLGAAAFHQVRAGSADLGVEVAVESLELDLLSYALEVVRPTVYLQVGSTAPDSAASGPVEALPVDYFPALHLVQGRVLYGQPDGLEIIAEDLDVSYEVVDDTLGQLSVSLPRWILHNQSQERGRGRLHARLTLTPRLLSLSECRLSGRVDSLEAELQLDGRLALVESLPLLLTARSRFHVLEDSLQAQLDLQARGGLQPLALEVAVEGNGQLDWGDLSLRGRAELAPGRIVVEPLSLGLLGGRLQGRVAYLPDLDSLAVELEMEGVDMAQLPGSDTEGLAQGSCRAWLLPGSQRYSADLEMELRQLDLLPGGPFDFALSAALRPDQSLRVELRSQLGHLQAAGHFDPHSAYELALEGVLEAALVTGLQLEPVQLSGRVEPEAVELSLETAHLPLEKGGFGTLMLDLKLRRQRFLEAVLALEEDQALLRLFLDLEKGEIDSLVSVVTPLALSRLDPDLQGSLRGQVQGGGALDVSGAQLSGQFELLGAAYQNWHTGPLQVQLGYEAQRLNCRLESRGFAVDATLDSLTRFAGQAQLDEALFHHISATDAGLDSVARVLLSGTINWAGHLERPEALEAQVALRQLQWDQGAWALRAAGPVQLSYSQQQTTVQPFVLDTPLGRLEAVGQVHSDSVAVVVEMAAMELQQLAPQLRGRGRAQLEVGGTLDHPVLHSRVDLEQVSLDDRALGDLSISLQSSDSLSLKAVLEQNREADPELVVALSLPSAALLTGASDPAAGDLKLQVRARQLDLQAPLSYLLADSVRGRLDLEGNFAAPLEKVLADSLQWRGIQGSVLFERLQVEKQGLRLALPSGGRIALEDDHLDLSELDFAVEIYDRETDAFRAGGRVQLGGQVAAARFFLLQLNLQELDLLVLENLGAGALPAGILNLQAGLSGTRAVPALEVQLDLEMEDLGEVEGRFRGSPQEGVLELDGSTLIGDELQVRGRLPWDLGEGEILWDQGILRTQSEGLSLLILLDQFPELENIDGTLGLDLELRGFDETLDVRGQVDIEDLELSLIDVKPGYIFPSGRLEFSGRRGEFKDFVGGSRKGKGRIEITGFMALEALDQLVYEVHLEASDLPYNYDDIFDVPRLDIELDMHSIASGTLLAGRLQLEQAKVDLPLIDLNAPPVPPPPPAVQDEFLQGMELDIDVDISAMHIENELTDVEMEGSTRVYGTFYKPLFQGEMMIVEGKVFVLNNEFDFQRGRISLDRLVPTYSILDIAYDPLLLNPELDLSAVTTVIPIDAPDDDPFEITFLLEGPVQEVVPRFISEPAREDNEVLMLVAFGVLGNPTMLFNQENRGALYSTAGQLLLSRQVKKIGLDEFQLLPSGTLLETVGKPSMHLGKYFKVPVPLWVRYEAVTQNPALGEFRIEHKLRSYLTITGTAQSEKERYGLGLGIKKEF